jgi:hypothetical protein
VLQDVQHPKPRQPDQHDLGAEDHIHHIFYDAPTNNLYHDRWTAAAGAPLAGGSPATLVWPWQQHVFYRGQDSHIHHIFYDAWTNKLYRDQWTASAGVLMASGDRLATTVTG